MSTDRELLELAAKAAGVNGEWDAAYSGIVTVRGADGQAFCVWNPLREDGCALRLAVKLNLNVCCYGWRFDAKRGGIIHATEYTPAIGDDPYAATRRAIVRAAAKIGKAMP